MVQLNVKSIDLVQVKDEAIVLGLFEKTDLLEGAAKTLNVALNNEISKVIKQGDFKGKPSDTYLLRTEDKLQSKRVILQGLGKIDEFDLEKVRETAARSVAFAQKLGLKSISVNVQKIGSTLISVQDAGMAIT